MNICFDFDGPIIDVSDRYYRAYLESLRDADIEQDQILDKATFWKLKQNRITDFELGLMTGLTVKEARKSSERRKQLTFKMDYHHLDKIFEDVASTLDKLKKHNIPFFIVTLRRKSQLQTAIKQFKLNKFFNEKQLFCIADSKDFQGDILEKYNMLFDAVDRHGLIPQETWIVGDSEVDIHAGRLARYGKVVGISRGVRSEEQLKALKPDHVISNLKDILNLIAAKV